MTPPPTTKSAKKKVVAPVVRKRNPEQTRAKLLQATIDLLAAKGSDAVSLKEAARIADVSRAIAYRHFEDRDHLLREAKAWISDRLLESAQDIQPSSNPASVLQITEEHVNSVAELVLNNREAAKLLIADALAGNSLDIDHPILQMVVKDLETFKANGLARRDFDIEMLSYIMLGIVSTLVMLSHLPDAGGNKQLAKRFSQEWSHLLIGGLIAEQRKSTRKKQTAPAQKEKPKPKRATAATRKSSGRKR